MPATGHQPSESTDAARRSAGAEPIGSLLARVRTSRGESQLRLAELLCAASGHSTLTRHEISRWERGERVPGTHWLKWLAAVLDVPIAQLDEAARIARAGRAARAPGPPLWTPPAAPSRSGLLEHGGPDLIRLAHAWLAREDPAPLLADQPQEAGHPRGRRRPVPAATLDALAQRLRRLRRTDDMVGGADLADTVQRELRIALDLLEIHRPGRRLLRLIAGLAQLAGWTAADAGRPDAAVRAYRLGLSAATGAADRALGAHLLGCLSHLVAEQDPRQALLLARTAAAGVRPSSGSLQALLLHRVAFAAALAGERRASERALAAAERAADRRGRDRDPAWLYWLDDAELESLTGRCFTALRRPLRAEPLLRRRWDQHLSAHVEGAAGPARRPRGPRTVAIDGSWLTETYLDAGEAEQACHIARLALLAAIRSGSPRAAGRALAPKQRLVAANAGDAGRQWAALVLAAEPYLPSPGVGAVDLLPSG